MKLIFRERDSQKARQLFEEAERREMAGEKVVIITPNSRALRVKALGYGFHLNIVEPNDISPELIDGASVILHNVDKLIDYYFDSNFINSKVVAMSATLQEE